jgi:hypothetical protein
VKCDCRCLAFRVALHRRQLPTPGTWSKCLRGRIRWVGAYGCLNACTPPRDVATEAYAPKPHETARSFANHAVFVFYGELSPGRSDARRTTVVPDHGSELGALSALTSLDLVRGAVVGDAGHVR